MKRYKHLILILAALLSVGIWGCSKESPLQVDSSSRRKALAYTPTETDKWIQENLVKKYNIEPIWRWKDIETDYEYNLVPPLEENVVPFLKVLDKAFIQSYVDVAGADFMKTYVPKQFLLVGSNAYNKSGTITLGQAEGGLKIVLYGVNEWKNQARIYRFLHTMFHEFSHILHQTKLYTEDFEKVTPESYTAQWFNVDDEEALEAGFITPYSMLNKNEDFVELISTYVTTSEKEWNEIIDGISGRLAGKAAADIAIQEGRTEEEAKAIGEATAVATAKKAKEALARKMSIIKDYLKTDWDIEIDELREVTLRNIDTALADMQVTPLRLSARRMLIETAGLDGYACSHCTHAH